MKRIIALLLFALMLTGVAGCAQKEEESASSAETALKWIDARIEGDSLFSFKYDGREFADFISGWEKTVDSSETGRTLVYRSPEGVSVTAEIDYDAQYSALDWCCYYENGGSADSPVISDIRAIDAECEMSAPVLTVANGSDSSAADFEPRDIDLSAEKSYGIRTNGGRSSQGAFPYFDLHNGECGIVGAIGWTGNWRADFERTENGVSVSAGMKETSISLHAGEKMRTPSIVLVFFTGDQDAGHNQFRRLMIQSYTPSDEEGRTLTHLPILINNWGGVGEDRMLGTVALLDRTGLYYDGFWVDAGWYGDELSANTYDAVWAEQTGNWYFCEEGYPEGITNVAAALHERNKQLLLWFEPERAVPGTKYVTEHPEYYLPASDSYPYALIDFSRDDATDFMISLIGDIIKENGIDWYRQDFNMDPAEKWEKADKAQGENRTGITEAKYIENLYRYLDTLLADNPGLMMDNCSSGGKRLDIEMMKRSVPLWRTDYPVIDKAANYDGVRNSGYNLSWWLPLSGGGGTGDGYTTPYHWRAAMGSGMTIAATGVNQDYYKRMTEQYLKCRELMTGDYYILAAGRGESYCFKNAVYEYYTPETGEGYIVAFRPTGSREESGSYLLKGLDAQAAYSLEIVDTGETLEYTGEQLMTLGVKFAFAEGGQSALVYISKK